jgi:E3 ubiquitin-protein ligase RNF1/2
MSNHIEYITYESGSDSEDLSEREERNLDSILVLFSQRETKEDNGPIDDDTFKKVKTLMTCPVCLEIYKDPVFVKKCLHRFCRSCIERVIRRFFGLV